MTGYQSKKAAAFIAAEERKVRTQYGYFPKLHPSEYMDEQPTQAKVKGPLHVVCQCDKCKAQPAQEPVAHCEAGPEFCSVCLEETLVWTEICRHLDKLPLAAQPAPAGYAKKIEDLIQERDKWKAKVQRPWVGLTEDELLHIGVATGLERAAMEMISNKLKEKNT